MTFAYWCVILTAFLPVMWTGLAKYGAAEDYDNSQPRISLAKLTGWPARANWAHLNAFEAFPPFAVGVVIAHKVGAGQMIIDLLAGTFILCRIVHGIVYIADYPTIRSLVWTTGFLAMTGLYIASAAAS